MDTTTRRSTIKLRAFRMADSLGAVGANPDGVVILDFKHVIRNGQDPESRRAKLLPSGSFPNAGKRWILRPAMLADLKMDVRPCRKSG